MKTWKNLLIPVIVVAVLATAFAAYKIFFTNDDEPDTSETQINEPLLSVPVEQVASVNVWQKSTDTYIEISAHGYMPEPAFRWVYSDGQHQADQYKLSQDMMQMFVNVLRAYDVKSVIAQGEDHYIEYGLDTPRYVITVTEQNEQVHTILIGDDAVDDKYVYCALADTKEIVTVSNSKLSMADRSILDFMDRGLFDVGDDQIMSVAFERQGQARRVVADRTVTEDGSYYWLCSEPVERAGGDLFTRLIQDISELSASRFVEVDPKDFSVYGLDQPAYTFDFSLASGRVEQVIMSGDVGGYYYGAVTGLPAIFMINTSSIDGLNRPLVDLLSPHLFFTKGLRAIDQFSRITMTVDDTSFIMDIDVPDGAGVRHTDAVTKVDQVDVRVTDSANRSYFALLFESIISINFYEFDFDVNPELADPFATIVLAYKDGNRTTLDLVKRDDRTYYAFIDGDYQGYIVHRNALYQDNGARLYNYGAWAAYERLNEARDHAIGGVYDIES